MPKEKVKKVLVLRTCSEDMTSYSGFKWPKSGKVSCDDWNNIPECGNGLHGLLWGEGNGGLLNWAEDAKWLVVEVEKDKIVDIGGKVKFPDGIVKFCGAREKATQYIVDNGGADKVIVGKTAAAGNEGTATAGYHGTAAAGDEGIATAGNFGTAAAGNEGIAIAGDFGTATAGFGGTATAGGHGTATAGDHGTATAGDHGTATAGYHGTATAGNHGTIIIKYWNGKRYKFKVGYIGENNLKPNVKYKLNDKFKFIKVK